MYCVSRILFSMSLAMDVLCATYSLRLAMDHVEGTCKHTTNTAMIKMEENAEVKPVNFSGFYAYHHV